MTEKNRPIQEVFAEGSFENDPSNKVENAEFPKVEKYKIDPKTKQDIEDLEAEIKFRTSPTNEDLRESISKKDTGAEPYKAPVVSMQPRPKSKLKNAVMGFAALLGFGTATAAKPEMGNLNDSTKNKSVATGRTQGDSLSRLKVYQGGKTKEGATTPTGFNNSFFNNEYAIHEGDVEAVAKQFGFRTDNIENFQADMFGRLEKEYPEEMKRVVEKYGLPAAGKMVDKILGVRVAFALSILKNKIPNASELKNEVDPYAAFAKTWEPLYDQNKHIAAQMHYNVRQSNSISKGGALNTGEEDVLLIFRGDSEPGPNAPSIIVKKSALDQLLAGTKYFQSQEKLSELVKKAKKKTYIFTGEEFAKEDTK